MQDMAMRYQSSDKTNLPPSIPSLYVCTATGLTVDRDHQLAPATDCQARDLPRQFIGKRLHTAEKQTPR